MYKGVIIKNSLKDPRVLEGFKVLEKETSGDWELFTVEATREQVKQLADAIEQGWYTHFWKDRDVIGFVVLDESDEAEAHLQEVKELETNLRNGTLDPWCRNFHLDARIMSDDIFPNLSRLFWDEKWDEVRQVVDRVCGENWLWE